MQPIALGQTKTLTRHTYARTHTSKFQMQENHTESEGWESLVGHARIPALRAQQLLLLYCHISFHAVPAKAKRTSSLQARKIETEAKATQRTMFPSKLDYFAVKEKSTPCHDLRSSRQRGFLVGTFQNVRFFFTLLFVKDISVMIPPSILEMKNTEEKKNISAYRLLFVLDDTDWPSSFVVE